MLVSVVVPIFNKEQYLERVITSLINQTYKEIEIILIDDGSKDNSKSICERFSRKDARIILHSQENTGVSQARNKGVEIAKGKYITFVDADDYVKEDFIKEMLKNKEKDNIVNINWNKKSTTLSCNEYLKDFISAKVLGVCWGYLLDTDIVKKIKFDSNISYMEDTVFMIEYLTRVSKIKLINSQIYCHEYNEESLTADSTNLNRKINEYVYAIDQIKEILKKNKKYNEFFKKSLEIRTIKIIEAEFAKSNSEETIRKLIGNRKVKSITNYTNVPIRYKLFVYLVKNEKDKKIYRYIKLREKIKNIKKRLKK